jgi:Zn-dependent M28 family amino/carboxypeptidase
MKLFVVLCAAAALASAQSDRIEGERVRPHVKFLSSDLLEGRGPGARGGLLAQEYIAAQFAAAGLKPAGDGGTYVQKVPLKLVEPEATKAHLSFSVASRDLELKWLDDFIGTTHQQQSKVDFNAEAVFVGHGIRAPEFGWDDYKGVDVKGKVVVLFTGEPPSDDPKFFAGKALTYYGRWTYKYEEAARQGAIGALIIHTTPTASYGWEVVRGQSRPMPQVAHVLGTPALALAGWLTSEAGSKLLTAVHLDVDSALDAANKRGFQARPLGAMVHARMEFRVSDINTGNVVGMVPGSDPKLKDEAVIFTAHWDHLGIGVPVNGDAIYNGALDNATGSAMLIEMARAWASMQPKPKRTAYFAAVTAEESGLLGSMYLASHPPVPVARIAANLNFDSFSPLGRTRDAGLPGAERTTLWDLVQKDAREAGLTLQGDLRPEAGGYYRSDHFSFARVGVPAFSIGMGSNYLAKPAAFTPERMKAFGASYHQPSDEYSEDWDFSGMEQFARFGFTLGVHIANLETLPSWHKDDEFLSAREKSGVR